MIARRELRRWGWALPAIVAAAGILMALMTNDHRLASRSAFVLLASFGIESLLAIAA